MLRINSSHCVLRFTDEKLQGSEVDVRLHVEQIASRVLCHENLKFKAHLIALEIETNIFVIQKSLFIIINT